MRREESSHLDETTEEQQRSRDYWLRKLNDEEWIAAEIKNMVESPLPDVPFQDRDQSAALMMATLLKVRCSELRAESSCDKDLLSQVALTCREENWKPEYLSFFRECYNATLLSPDLIDDVLRHILDSDHSPNP